MLTKKKVLEEKKAVSIDFPVEGEKILVGHYAVRMTTEEAGHVEISVNDQDWFPCRASVGYWWFDWQPLKAGRYKLAARLTHQNGKPIKSTVVNCTVIGGTLN